jgi:hypothetical protein
MFGDAKRYVFLITSDEVQQQHDKETTFGSSPTLSPRNQSSSRCRIAPFIDETASKA